MFSMKKLLCIISAMLLLCFCASAQEADTFTLWFEEGFSLDLPQGWVSYPTDASAQLSDIRYILSDSEAQRYMYIMYRPTTFADIAALDSAVAADEAFDKTGDLVFDGCSFIAFAMPGQDLSGCMTLHDGHLLTFVYSPQSDSEYMMLAASIMDTFNCIEQPAA